MKDDLEAKLVAVFPAQVIDRQMIDEPTATWDIYDEAGELHIIEGKTWHELSADVLERHGALLNNAAIGYSMQCCRRISDTCSPSPKPITSCLIWSLPSSNARRYRGVRRDMRAAQGT